MGKLIYLFITALFLISCNHVIQGSDLTSTDIQRLQKLGILDKDERVIKFFSEYKKKYAGNFITRKRIATYWIDPMDPKKNKVYSAFYDEIASMDTISKVGLSYCPYILVKKVDGTSFKVSVSGDSKEVYYFFVDALMYQRVGNMHCTF